MMSDPLEKVLDVLGYDEGEVYIVKVAIGSLPRLLTITKDILF